MTELKHSKIGTSDVARDALWQLTYDEPRRLAKLWLVHELGRETSDAG